MAVLIDLDVNRM